MIQSKSLRCRIRELACTDGSKVSEDAAIKTEILGFFSGLLGSPAPCSADILGQLREALPQTLSLELQNLVSA